MPSPLIIDTKPRVRYNRPFATWATATQRSAIVGQTRRGKSKVDLYSALIGGALMTGLFAILSQARQAQYNGMDCWLCDEPIHKGETYWAIPRPHGLTYTVYVHGYCYA